MNTDNSAVKGLRVGAGTGGEGQWGEGKGNIFILPTKYTSKTLNGYLTLLKSLVLNIGY